MSRHLLSSCVAAGVGMAALLLICAVPERAAAQADTSWSALYRMDLDTARAVIEANHPGMFDRQNPEFARTLRSAYAEAHRAAPLVDSYRSYAIALRRFGNRFQDAHLNVGGKRWIEPVREAGLYPEFNGGAFVVADVDSSRYGAVAGQIRGAVIERCDGIPADRLFREGVLSWRGRASVQADWILLAPYLLVDYGPPTRPGPARCVFRTGASRIEVPLHWAPAVTAQVEARRHNLVGFPRRPLGLDVLENGRVLWVNVPTFALQGDSAVTAMRTLVDSLGAHAREESWKLLVFDLRGNSGGNSAWGRDIARAVFGQRWIDDAVAWLSDGVYAEWRASPGNIASNREVLAQVERQRGAESSGAAGYRVLLDSLSAALQRGSPYFSQPKARQGLPRPAAVPLPGRVVVITSAHCYSACLDFMDLIRLVPGVIHVGATTGVDTQYIENWGRDLPSGVAAIGHPMKVWRNRRRGSSEAYAPDIPAPVRLRDTDALRTWVISRFGPEGRR